MKMHTALKTAALALALAWPAATASADVEAAKRLYEQAKAEKDPQKQIKLLRDSVAQEDTFVARYALGEALHASKAQADARAEFQKAFSLAADDKARARALAMSAETYLAEDKRQDGLALLRRSQQFFAYPNVEARLKEVELASLDKPVPASEIASALNSPAARAFGVKPAVSLRIGFDYDKASLTAGGQQQATELGKALQAAKGTSYQIIGHTDTQGDAAYNEKLSLRRAETVKEFLIKNHGLSAASLTVVGKGETEPLYKGNTEQDHALNRRVEVVAQ